MDAQILRELETAAQILLASPNLVTSEQRHAAESVFMNFRKTKSPYSLCMQILETSKVDYVLFEVAGLLKDALIREWSFLQESDISFLRQYLFKYVIDRPTLPPFVREKILQVIAIISKRGSLNDIDNQKDLKHGNNHSKHREVLLNEIEQLIMNGNQSQKLVGCSLLAAILQEYSVTVKSSDIGLPVETHFKAKENFGIRDLKRIFQFCCRALSNLANLDPPFSNEALSLIKHLLSISETILTWDFAFSVRYGIGDASSYNVSFIPGPTWKDVLLDPQVVNLFFLIYWKIRHCPQLSHHALTCLVQLSTVDCQLFSSSERINYFENYQKEFMKLITSVEILDREALGISNIIKKIFLHCSSSSTSQNKISDELFKQMTLLTCNFAQGAAKEETLCAEDRLYMEAFDHMMGVWMTILCWSNSSLSEYSQQAFQEIFNVYLRSHLSPPEGTRGQGTDLELEELDESEETDREKFSIQLYTIGGFGQNIPEYCLPLLSRLLEDRTKILRNHMDKLYQQGPTISDSSALVFLFEDLHWLLLISGNVLCSESTGDPIPQIPKKLMSYSIAQSSTSSIDISLKVFGSPNLDFTDIEGADQKTDHVLRLIAAVFRLGHMFKKFTEAKLTQFLSPEVISSLLWFMKEWSAAFLLPKESVYSEISMPFLYAFGRDSEGGMWTINYLLDQVIIYLTHFNSEPGVVEDAVKLFISLTDSKEKSACVLKSEYLAAVMNIQARLPDTVKQDVFQGLVRVAVACEDESTRNDYWQKIFKPLRDRWRRIVCHENFSRIYQEEQIKTEVVDILDCLTGVVKGGTTSNSDALFQHLSPIFSDLPTLVGVYRNYQLIVELVFKLYCKCATSLLCTSQENNKKIYESCIQTIQTYAKCNVGRFSLDAEAQEDTFNDIYLLLKLFTDLLLRYYFELSKIDTMPNSDQCQMPVDACLYGLNLIMPLMNANLFKYPPLCRQYFQFIFNLSEMYPEKIFRLPDPLLKNILTTVELGLTSFGQDIFPDCCDFLNYAATHISETNDRSEPGHDSLKPFLKILIDLILSHLINSDHLPNAGSALFALIRCYQQDYQSLVHALLSAQQPDIGERLGKAFASLMNNISLSHGTQQQKLQFSKNFDEFVAKTHGFLHIK